MTNGIFELIHVRNWINPTCKFSKNNGKPHIRDFLYPIGRKSSTILLRSFFFVSTEKKPVSQFCVCSINTSIVINWALPLPMTIFHGHTHWHIWQAQASQGNFRFEKFTHAFTEVATSGCGLFFESCWNLEALLSSNDIKREMFEFGPKIL